MDSHIHSPAQKCKFEFYIKQCTIDGIKFPCNYFIEIKTGNNKSLLTKSSKSVLSIENHVAFNQSLFFQVDLLTEKNNKKYMITIDQATQHKSIHNLNVKKNKSLTATDKNPADILILLNLTSTRRPDQVKLVGRYTFNLDQLILGYKSNQSSYQRNIKLEYSSVQAHIIFIPKILNITHSKFDPSEFHMSKDVSGFQQLISQLDNDKSSLKKSNYLPKQTQKISNIETNDKNHSKNKQKQYQYSAQPSNHTIQKSFNSSNNGSRIREQPIIPIQSINKSPQNSSSRVSNRQKSQTNKQYSHQQHASSKWPQKQYSQILESTQRQQRQIWKQQKQFIQQQLQNERKQNRILTEQLRKAQKKVYEKQLEGSNLSSTIQNLKRQHKLQIRQKQSQKSILQRQNQKLKQNIRQNRNKMEQSEMEIRKYESDKIQLQGIIEQLQKKHRLEIQNSNNKQLEHIKQQKNKLELQIQKYRDSIQQLEGKYGNLQQKWQQKYTKISEQYQKLQKNIGKYQQQITQMNIKYQEGQRTAQQKLNHNKQYVEGLQLQILKMYQQKTTLQDNYNTLSNQITIISQQKQQSKIYEQQLQTDILQKHQQIVKLKQQNSQLFRKIQEQASNSNKEIYSRDYIEGLQQKIIADYEDIMGKQKQIEKLGDFIKQIQGELEMLKHSYAMNEEASKQKIQKLIQQLQKCQQKAPIKTQNTNKIHQLQITIQQKQQQIYKLSQQLLQASIKQQQISASDNIPNKQLITLQNKIIEKQQYIIELENNLSEKTLKIQELQYTLNRNMPPSRIQEQQQVNVKINVIQVNSANSEQQDSYINELQEVIEQPGIRVFEVLSNNSNQQGYEEQCPLPMQSVVKQSDQKKKTESQPSSIPPGLKKNQQFDDLDDFDTPKKKQGDILSKSDKFSGIGGLIHAFGKTTQQKPNNQQQTNNLKSMLQRQRKLAKNTSQKLQKQLKLYKQKYEAQENMFKQSCHKKVELQAQIKKYKLKLDQLKSKQNSLEETLGVIQEQANHMLAQLYEKDKIIQQLQQIVNQNQQNAQNNKKQQKQYQEIQKLKRKIDNLENQLSISHEQLMVNKRLLMSIRQKQSSVSPKINNKAQNGQQQNSDKFYEIMKLNARIQELEQQIFSYQSSDNYNQIRINQLTEQIAHHAFINNQLIKQIQQLKMRSPRTDNNNQQINTNKQLQIANQQLKQQISALQQNLQTLSMQVQDKQYKIDELENLLIKQRKQSQKNKKQLEQQIRSNHKKQNVKVLKKTSNNQSETSSIRILQEEVGRITQILQDKQNQHHGLFDKNIKLQEQIAALKYQLGNKTIQLQLYQQKCKKYQNMIHHNNQYQHNKIQNQGQQKQQVDQLEYVQQQLEFVKVAYQQVQQENKELVNKLKNKQQERQRMSLEWEQKQFQNMNNQLDLQIRLQQQENQMKRSVNASNRSHRENNQTSTSQADITIAAKMLKQCIDKRYPYQVQIQPKNQNQSNSAKMFNLLNSPSAKSDQGLLPANMQDKIQPKSARYLHMLLGRIMFMDQQLIEQQSTISIQAIRAVMIQKSRMVSMQLSKSKTEVMRMKVQHSDRLMMLQLFKPIDMAIKGLVQTAENIGNEQLAHIIEQHQQQSQINNIKDTKTSEFN